MTDANFIKTVHIVCSGNRDDHAHYIAHWLEITKGDAKARQRTVSSGIWVLGQIKVAAKLNEITADDP